MTEILSYQLEKNIAFITMDDGKVNALSFAMLEKLEKALDRAAQEAGALCIAGRPGRLSGGFDLSVMTSGAEGLRKLVGRGAELLLRIWEFPRPVIIACTGHAMAAGALMLLAADYRIGVDGPFRIGLNEVSIGMPIPIIGVELARERLTPRYLQRATLLAEVFNPQGALEAGYLDEVLPPESLEGRLMEKAAQLTELKDPAFGITRGHLRREKLEYIRQTLEADLANLSL